MLRKLAEATENMTVLANKKPQCYQKQLVLYSLYQQDKQCMRTYPTQDKTSVLTGND